MCSFELVVGVNLLLRNIKLFVTGPRERRRLGVQKLSSL